MRRLLSTYVKRILFIVTENRFDTIAADGDKENRRIELAKSES